MRYRVIKLSGDRQTFLYAYLHEDAIEAPRRPAVILLTDGANLEMQRKAELAALFFWKKGCCAFLLDSASPHISRGDVFQAVRRIRDQAGSFGNDPGAVVLIGISSGVLAAFDAATHWKPSGGTENKTRDIERSRPDAVILVCGQGPEDLWGSTGTGEIRFLSGKIVPGKQDNSLTENLEAHVPPIFLWHASNGNQARSVRLLPLVQSLQRQSVSCEIHILRKEGICTADGECEWMEASLRWLYRLPIQYIPFSRTALRYGEDDAEKKHALQGRTGEKEPDGQKKKKGTVVHVRKRFGGK